MHPRLQTYKLLNRIVQKWTHTNGQLRHMQRQFNGERMTFSASDTGTTGDLLTKNKQTNKQQQQKTVNSTSQPIQNLT